MERPRAVEEHEASAPKHLKVAIFTASSTRYRKKLAGEPYKDDSGEVAIKAMEELGHEVNYLGVVDDDIQMIRQTIYSALTTDVDVIIVIGGTGIARRDVTIEAVRPLFEKEIEGFGEVLRMESYKKIGPAAALTRSTAGVIGGKVVLLLPGSPDAVKTAMELFGWKLPHMVYLARLFI